jgi:hypothetical protein
VSVRWKKHAPDDGCAVDVPVVGVRLCGRVQIVNPEPTKPV